MAAVVVAVVAAAAAVVVAVVAAVASVVVVWWWCGGAARCRSTRARLTASISTAVADPMLAVSQSMERCCVRRCCSIRS